MEMGGFDPNKWDCPCGGVSDVYELKNEAGEVVYHVMECKTCGNWRRYVQELGDQEIGPELPPELKAGLDERGEKIRAASDPLEGAEAMVAAAAVPSASPEIPMEAPEPLAAPPWAEEGGSVKKDRGEPLQPRSEDGTEAPLDIKLPLPDEQGVPPESMDPTDPMMMHQGTIMDCGYCKHVYPELKGECPVCRGSGPVFRPARMMDRQTSLHEVLQAIFNLAEMEWKLREFDEEPPMDFLKEYKSRLLNIVEMVGLYQFDAGEAFKGRIYELDMRYGIDPKEPF